MFTLLSVITPITQSESESIERIFFNSIQKVSAERLSRARAMLAPLILRRSKVNVLSDLPKKITSVIQCTSTAVQRRLYTQAEQDGDHVSSESLLEAKNLTSNKLSNMRKIANHPLMSRVNFTDEMVKEMAYLMPRELDFIDQKPEHILEDISMLSDVELYDFCERYPRHLERFKFADSVFFDAGKIQTLKEMLPERISKVRFHLNV